MRRAGLDGARLVVAVSGGPDSLTMLHVLASVRQDLKLTLHVAHVDHGLRTESADDVRFVATEAKRLVLPHTICRVDVPAYRASVAGRGLSIEHAARELRYGALAQVARKVKAKAVVTAHTANDQAETILLHIARGSGLRGLRGMQPVSTVRGGGGDVEVFRPFLRVTREDVESFCALHGLHPRHDASNLDVSYTRNRVRYDVMPHLRTLNPDVRESLVRLGRAATSDDTYLTEQLEALWQGIARQSTGQVTLNRQALKALPPALLRRATVRAYEDLRGSTDGLEEAHVEAIVRSLQGKTGRALNLPGGLLWEVGYTSAVLKRADAKESALLPKLAGTHKLLQCGTTIIDGWHVTLSETTSRMTKTGAHEALLDSSAIAPPLEVRTRRSGDRFQPLGMKTPKSLQDFFVDAKVPRAQRASVPLLVAPKGIAWVVGWRIADWARVTPETRRILRIVFAQDGIIES